MPEVSGRALGKGFDLPVLGYRDTVSATRPHRSMRVDPHRVVELASRCDEAVQRLTGEWVGVRDELRAACDLLGDAAGAASVATAYAETVASADEVVLALARALEGGVAGLIDAARDVSQADDTVAAEIDRAASGHGLHRGWDKGAVPGHGRGGQA